MAKPMEVDSTPVTLKAHIAIDSKSPIIKNATIKRFFGEFFPEYKDSSAIKVFAYGFTDATKNANGGLLSFTFPVDLIRKVATGPPVEINLMGTNLTLIRNQPLHSNSKMLDVLFKKMGLNMCNMRFPKGYNTRHSKLQQRLQKLTHEPGSEICNSTILKSIAENKTRKRKREDS